MAHQVPQPALDAVPDDRAADGLADHEPHKGRVLRIASRAQVGDQGGASCALSSADSARELLATAHTGSGRQHEWTCFLTDTGPGTAIARRSVPTGEETTHRALRAVRRTAPRGPCGGGRRGSHGRPACACAAGSRGSSRGDGCSAGKYACSRVGSRLEFTRTRCERLTHRARPIECVGTPKCRRATSRPSYVTGRTGQRSNQNGRAACPSKVIHYSTAPVSTAATSSTVCAPCLPQPATRLWTTS